MQLDKRGPRKQVYGQGRDYESLSIFPNGIGYGFSYVGLREITSTMNHDIINAIFLIRPLFKLFPILQ